MVLLFLYLAEKCLTISIRSAMMKINYYHKQPSHFHAEDDHEESLITGRATHIITLFAFFRGLHLLSSRDTDPDPV